MENELNKPVTATDIKANEGKAHQRIDDSAERVKQAASSAVASSKEKVGRAADQVEAGLHKATDRTADAASRATDKAADLGVRGREMYDQSREQFDEWMDDAREYVREKPLQAVGIALGAGWVIGRILRR